MFHLSGKLLISRDSYDLCSDTRRACYFQTGADSISALFHPDQPKPCAIDTLNDESASIISKLQPNCVRSETQPSVELGCTRVLKRVGQRFLSNMQQVFFDAGLEVSRFAFQLKVRMQRGACGRVVNDRLQRIGKRAFFERLRPQRMNRTTRFIETFACQCP